jgi:hypothetical protein
LQDIGIFGQPLTEIYTDSPFPVNCLVASGREESDFYDVLGIVGAGPVGSLSAGMMVDNAYQGPELDGQPHHGFGTEHPSYGLRQVLGNDPAGATEPFCLTDMGVLPTDVYAAGVAFQEMRRVDAKGFQPSALAEHAMKAWVMQGLKGWIWTGAGTRSWATLTNPIWIAVNMIIRALGLRNADAATCEQFFDVEACIAAAAICDLSVAPLWPKFYKEWTPEEGHWGEGGEQYGQWIVDTEGFWTQIPVTEETQFKFRGLIQEEKPLRDWLREVLANCLGYYTFAFGKFKPGIRCNSSTVEAFTAGNILFESLQLAPAPAAFNRLTTTFACEDYDFKLFPLPLEDPAHQAFMGGGAASLVLQSNLNLCGTVSKSQASRILCSNLREELGGITAAEWKAARRVGFKTTVLALNVEPGKVCSMTHADMPNGTGEFRVQSWRLNPDYSIDIEGRTTVDSMYDLASGPKPADVLPEGLPANPYAAGAPNVLMFRAGTSNGDGTFTSEMYWDDARQVMLIDWACMLPEDRLNWGGVQIWVKKPKTGGFDYVKVTDVLTLNQFQVDITTGKLYRYDTIAIAPESVPDPPESWTFIAASYDRNGKIKQTISGVPIGPTITLDTLGKSDYVEDFAASIVLNPAEGKDQWGISATWTNPTTPRYIKTHIVLLGYGDVDRVQVLSNDNALTELSCLAGFWDWPSTSQSVTVVIQSVFGDGTVADLDDCPHVHLTVDRTLGTAGQEYCGLVTGIALSNATYAFNSDNARVFKCKITWTPPANDNKYAGGSLWIIYGGVHIKLGGKDFNQFNWETTDWPTTHTDVIFYVLSVDSLGNVNTYNVSVTPHLDYHWENPALGSAGQEYTSVVTGYSVAVTYPTKADGTYKALVTVTFTAPSSVSWGGIEIRTSTDSGTTWTTVATGAKSPLTFEMPVGITATTFRVGAFSFDTNHRVNTYVNGVTPTSDIIVGNAAGQFDMTKAKATTYDSDIFIIQDGKFKIWAFNGSLLVNGSVSTAALNATAINVGGGGGKPGKFGVYNASGVQIGFIGVEDGVEGAWFKTLGIGGTSKAAPVIVADSSGNVTMTGGKVVVSGTWGALAQTLRIDPSATYYPFELVGGDHSIGMSATYALGAEVIVQDSTPANRYPHASISRYIIPAGQSHEGEGWAWLRAYTGSSTAHPHVNIFATYDPTVSGADPDSADMEMGINSLDRLFLVHAGTDSGYVDLHEMVLKIGGTSVIGALGQMSHRFFNQNTIPAYTDLSIGEIAGWWDNDGGAMYLVMRPDSGTNVFKFAAS